MTLLSDDKTDSRCLWSVVIPAYNADGNIALLLSALEHQDVPRDQYQVIVVDDGSEDGTAKSAASFNDVVLLRQSNRGPAAARNYGAQVAKGEVVVFTDSDCVPESDWLRQMVAPLSDAAVVGVKGAYRTQQPSLIARFIQAEYEDKYRRMAGQESIDFIDTYSAAYRRDLFLEYQGFDEDFPVASAEDVEFSFRLADDGMRMVFNPDAVVYHQFEGTLWGYVCKKVKNGFWRLVAVARHPGKAIRDSHTPQVQKIQILLMFIAVVCLVIGLFQPSMLWGLVLSMVLHQLSSLPFQVRLFRRDRVLALVSLLLVPLRSLCIGLGLIGGAIAMIFGWRQRGR